MRKGEGRGSRASAQSGLVCAALAALRLMQVTTPKGPPTRATPSPSHSPLAEGSRARPRLHMARPFSRARGRHRLPRLDRVDVGAAGLKQADHVGVAALGREDEGGGSVLARAVRSRAR